MRRAIGLQALVGNVGGYIGLFLGYSFLQIPDTILYIVSRLKKYSKQSHNVAPTPLDITVQEVDYTQSSSTPNATGVEIKYAMNLQIMQNTERLNKLDERLNKSHNTAEK